MRTTPPLVALLAATALVLTGCGSSGSPGKQGGGTLTVLTPASTLALDPASSQNLATTSLSFLDRRLTTWDVKQGQDAKVVPDLATTTGPRATAADLDVHPEERAEVRRRLPITARTIKYGVERSFAPQLSGGLSYHKTLLRRRRRVQGPVRRAASSPSIATPDAKTIVFHLNKASGDWPWIARMPAFAPVPKKRTSNSGDLRQAPIASGPYKVESIKDGHGPDAGAQPELVEEAPTRCAPRSPTTSCSGWARTRPTRTSTSSPTRARTRTRSARSTSAPPSSLPRCNGNAAAKARLGHLARPARSVPGA